MNDAPELPAGVQAALDRLGISYEVLPCDPDFADTPAFCEKYGYPPDTAGNTILSKMRPWSKSMRLITTNREAAAPYTKSSPPRP